MRGKKQAIFSQNPINGARNGFVIGKYFIFIKSLENRYYKLSIFKMKIIIFTIEFQRKLFMIKIYLWIFLSNLGIF